MEVYSDVFEHIGLPVFGGQRADFTYKVSQLFYTNEKFTPAALLKYFMDYLKHGDRSLEMSGGCYGEFYHFSYILFLCVCVMALSHMSV